MHILRIPQQGGQCLINPESILRVQGMGNYCKIHFANRQKPLVVSKVLHWVQDRLPPSIFLRVHRSHLINKQHVRQMQGGECKTLLLANGELVDVSRRKSSKVKSLITII